MNKIEYVTKEKMREIKARVDRDPNIFVIELFGNQLPTEKLFMQATIKAIQIPYPDCKIDYDWYNDYIRDLLWIREPDIVMLVHDFDSILKADLKIKQWWIEDLKKYILPWWDGEVVGHMVDGYPRGFDVYLETESSQASAEP